MPVAYESDPAAEKLAKLEEWFKAIGGPVVVAFSGGVDSSVVLAAAARALGLSRVYAVTADSPTYSRTELEWAKRVAGLLGVNHVIIGTNELDDENFASNPPIRCYYCKKELAQRLKEVAERVGAKVIVDGTNSEDLGGHRPGYLAFKEESVRSPLAELGFTKSDIRQVARLLGLPNWDKPSMACLASRIPYGQRITLERLKRIEAAEEAVRALTGARQVRVRDHGDIARIEVGRGDRRLFFSEEVMDEVARRLKQLGWRYVALDLEGYRSGSMDEVLAEKVSPRAWRASASGTG
jgi:uncharacterized protein